nr:uncharacterized protein LOC103235266 isoform X4 [Chlorocebus sabaeus]
MIKKGGISLNSAPPVSIQDSDTNYPVCCRDRSLCHRHTAPSVLSTAVGSILVRFSAGKCVNVHTERGQSRLFLPHILNSAKSWFLPERALLSGDLSDFSFFGCLFSGFS